MVFIFLGFYSSIREIPVNTEICLCICAHVYSTYLVVLGELLCLREVSQGPERCRESRIVVCLLRVSSRFKWRQKKLD